MRSSLHYSFLDDHSLQACFTNLACPQLYSLGELCGLLPGDQPTSSQLHLMVTLSAGMGDNSPAVEKLKDALAGHDAFQKCYLVSVN